MNEPTFTDDEIDGLNHTKFWHNRDFRERQIQAKRHDDLSDQVDELESWAKMQDKNYEDLSDRVAELEEWVNRDFDTFVNNMENLLQGFGVALNLLRKE